MSVRKSSIVWLAVGAILIVLAVVIRFVVLPTASKLPSDLNQTQLYEGTVVGLDAAAFAAGDLGRLQTPEAPITADRSVTVNAVEGDTAIVTSKAVIHLPGDTTQNDVHTYAVSRVDFSPVTLTPEQHDSLVPEEQKATFEPHEGVAFAWPPNPPQDGTSLYDPVTQTAQEAVFANEGTLAGRDVNNYVVDASGPVKSPAVLAGFAQFPTQIPKSVVVGLLEAGAVPAGSQELIRADLAELPELIDVGFSSSNKIDAAVDKQFGSPLRFDQEQSLFATIPVGGQQVNVLPLSTLKLHTADFEVTAGGDTASKNATLLAAIGVWVPIAFVIIGLLLIALAIARWRKPAVDTDAPVTRTDEPQPL
jgi:hypothetical protein